MQPGPPSCFWPPKTPPRPETQQPRLLDRPGNTALPSNVWRARVVSSSWNKRAALVERVPSLHRLSYGPRPPGFVFAQGAGRTAGVPEHIPRTLRRGMQRPSSKVVDAGRLPHRSSFPPRGAPFICQGDECRPPRWASGTYLALDFHGAAVVEA